MDLPKREKLKKFYHQQLLDNVVPFWIEHGLDRTHGGIITGLSRNGEVIDDDKGVWQQGRAAWLFSKLAFAFPEKTEFYDAATRIIQFLERFGTDSIDDRMWFHLTRDGTPIRKRRYAFSESFAAIAFAQFSRLTSDRRYALLAESKFNQFLERSQNPQKKEWKNTGNRPLRTIGGPMIAINTAQELRDAIDYQKANDWIRWGIETIHEYHVHESWQCVFESVTPDGRLDLDHFEGRTLNPGHAIEGAWFIMWEGFLSQNDNWIRLGLRMLDWMLDRGWDQEHGGLLYFVSADHRPISEYWHNMKFWWPHNETIIATLLAWCLTGDEKYTRWHSLVHDWAFSHFADNEYGEWYGYLNRDGTISNDLKGNLWKGPFHLPRMLLQCCEILDRCFPLSLPMRRE